MGLRDYTAVRLLEALFADGKPIPSTEVRAIARENRIAKKTLERAAKTIGIRIKRDGPPNDNGAPTWRWHPPDHRPAVLDSVRADEIAIF